MKDYVYGQPNLYGLFMAKGLELLKKDGQYIYITPRSWVSGLYYTEVRKAILKTDIEKNPYFLRPRYCFFRGTSLAGNNDPFWKKGKRANREN